MKKTLVLWTIIFLSMLMFAQTGIAAINEFTIYGRITEIEYEGGVVTQITVENETIPLSNGVWGEVVEKIFENDEKATFIYNIDARGFITLQKIIRSKPQ